MGRPPTPTVESLFTADEPEVAAATVTEEPIEIVDTEADSADEYFVYVEVQDPDAPASEATEATEEGRVPVTSVETTVRSGSPLISPETGRRPTRPTKYAGRGRSIRTIIEAPQPLPKKSAQIARRRTEKLSMWRLAKKADDYKLSTAEHAENIAKELSLTPQGRQRCLEILRGIRTGHRQLSAKIRKTCRSTPERDNEFRF